VQRLVVRDNLECGLRAGLRVKFDEGCVERCAVTSAVFAAEFPYLFVEGLQAGSRPADSVDPAAKVAEGAVVRSGLNGQPKGGY
jgi:hypothetical protein